MSGVFTGGTLFLDKTSGQYTFGRVGGVAVRGKSLTTIYVKKGNYDGDFEMYTHESLKITLKRPEFTYSTEPVPVPLEYINVNFYSYSTIIYTSEVFKSDPFICFEVYFKKSDVKGNPPLIIGIVTKERKKKYYTCGEILNNQSIALSSLSEICEKELQSKLVQETNKNVILFKIDQKYSYTDVSVTESWDINGSKDYKKCTHTVSVDKTKFKILLLSSKYYYKVSNYNGEDFCIKNLKNTDIYFFKTDSANRVPLAVQINKSEDQIIYYELKSIDYNGQYDDPEKWVKTYTRLDSIESNIIGKLEQIKKNSDLLEKINKIIGSVDNIGAIAGGVTITVILGAGGVAGGVLYYKYPEQVLSLISKIIRR